MTTETKDLKIGYAPIKIDDFLADLLAEKLPDIPVDYLKKETEENRLLLFGIFANEQFLGCFFVRVDRLISGEKELAILYTVSAVNLAVPLSSVITNVYEMLVKDTDIKSIRIHSDRRAIDRFLEEAGFKELNERIFRKVF